MPAGESDADVDADADADPWVDTGKRLEDLEPDLDEGRQIHDSTCVEGCHFRDGLLQTRSPVLSDAQLHRRIEEGTGRMPAIETLDHQDVVDVIGFLRVEYPP